jgi:hypothetical protein
MKTLAYVWEWNLNTISIIVFGSLILSAAVVFFLITFFKKKSRLRQMNQIKLNSSNVTVYIFNIKDNTIRSFSKKEIGNQRVLTSDAFFNSLTDKNEASSLREWLNNYLHGKNQEASILTVRTMMDSRKECFSIYRITYFNVKMQILHFEKCLLPEVSEKHTRKKEMAYQMDDIVSYVKSNRKIRFVAFYIKLVPYLSVKNGTDTTTQSLYMTSILQPLNEVQKYLSSKRRLVLIDDDSAVIFDFMATHRADIISFCNLLVSEIQRYFSISALNNLYDIAIGCAYYDSKEVFSEVLKRAEELADKAAARENIKYLIEGDATAEGNYSSFSSEEISSLIANRTYRIYFTPLIQKDSGSKTFLVDIKPYGITQTSFFDLAIAADKYSLLVPLLVSVFKDIDDSLASADLQSAIVTLPFSKSGQILEALKLYPQIKNKLIVSFSKNEIHDFFEADVNLDKVFSALKQNIRLALNFYDYYVDSPADLLSRFDMFLISLGGGDPLYMDERKKSALISDFSILSGFSKPIVISGIQAKSDLKIAVELGFSTFASDKLEGPSSCPYQPDYLFDDVKDEDEDEELRKSALNYSFGR